MGPNRLKLRLNRGAKQADPAQLHIRSITVYASHMLRNRDVSELDATFVVILRDSLSTCFAWHRVARRGKSARGSEAMLLCGESPTYTRSLLITQFVEPVWAGLAVNRLSVTAQGCRQGCGRAPFPAVAVRTTGCVKPLDARSGSSLQRFTVTVHRMIE